MQFIKPRARPVSADLGFTWVVMTPGCVGVGDTLDVATQRWINKKMARQIGDKTAFAFYPVDEHHRSEPRL